MSEHPIIEQLWERPLRKITSFSGRVVSLEPPSFLPYNAVQWLSRLFWGYHSLLAAIVLIDIQLHVLDKDTIWFAAYPLILF